MRQPLFKTSLKRRWHPTTWKGWGVFLIILCLIVAALAGIRLFLSPLVIARSTIERRAECRVDTDCVIIGSSVCGLGCYAVINASYEPEVRARMEAAAKTQTDCHLDCPAPGTPRCVEQRCTMGNE